MIWLRRQRGARQNCWIDKTSLLKRRLNKKLLLVGAAVAVAAIATFGPSDNRPVSTTEAPAAAVDYVTSHRLDLGSPGIAVGVVTPGRFMVGAAGNVTPDTPIPVGSVTKSFTALAVMQLVEAGKLSLDDPVIQHLPAFATSDAAISARITVRQLLSHSSGLSTAAGVDPLSGPESNLDAQVAALRSQQVAAPGTFTYSNANYEVLGQLIERVSGQSYAAYVHDHILAPLKMTHTYTDLAAARRGGLADGHRIWFGLGVPTGVFYRADFLPAGFLVSTVNDLIHYLTAMLDAGRFDGRSVLSAKGVQTLTSTAVKATSFGVPGGYGFGWYQRPTGDLNLVVDPGVAQNVHADLVLALAKHTGLVLLSNAESDLYLATIPKFDLAAFNATSIAAVGSSPGGLVEGFYVIFDLIVLGALFLYLRTLVRVIQRRVSWYEGGRWYHKVLALWREIFVPVVILIELPAVYGESWRYLVTGDVGFFAAVIALIGLLTLSLRAVFGLTRGSVSLAPARPLSARIRRH